MGYKRNKKIDFKDERLYGQVGKKMDEYEGVHEGNRIGKQNLVCRMLLNSAIRRIYVLQIHGSRKR